MSRILGMCLNWKVAAALGAVAVAVWLVAPALVAPLLPLLFLALCPISMAVMAWSMRGEGMAAHTNAAADPAARLAALEAEHTRVGRELERLRREAREQQAEQPVAHDEQPALQVSERA